MKRRDFFKSLGVISVAPVAVSKALAATDPIITIKASCAPVCAPVKGGITMTGRFVPCDFADLIDPYEWITAVEQVDIVVDQISDELDTKLLEAIIQDIKPGKI